MMILEISLTSPQVFDISRTPLDLRCIIAYLLLPHPKSWTFLVHNYAPGPGLFYFLAKNKFMNPPPRKKFTKE